MAEFTEFLKQLFVKQSLTDKIYWRHVGWRSYVEATNVTYV
jgi:hypothetical protein